MSSIDEPPSLTDVLRTLQLLSTSTDEDFNKFTTNLGAPLLRQALSQYTKLFISLRPVKMKRFAQINGLETMKTLCRVANSFDYNADDSSQNPQFHRGLFVKLGSQVTGFVCSFLWHLERIQFGQTCRFNRVASSSKPSKNHIKLEGIGSKALLVKNSHFGYKYVEIGKNVTFGNWGEENLSKLLKLFEFSETVHIQASAIHWLYLGRNTRWVVLMEPSVQTALLAAVNLKKLVVDTDTYYLVNDSSLSDFFKVLGRRLEYLQTGCCHRLGITGVIHQPWFGRELKLLDMDCCMTESWDDGFILKFIPRLNKLECLKLKLRYPTSINLVTQQPPNKLKNLTSIALCFQDVCFYVSI